MTKFGRLSSRRSTGCLILLALGMLVAGVAQAKPAAPVVPRIVPGKSLAGIKIGQSESVIKSAIGKPSTRNCGDEESATANSYKQCALTYTKNKLLVVLINDAAIQISTTSSKPRTTTGVGVGSTRAALDAAYPKCKDPDKSYCILGSTKKTGDRYTYFPIVKGKVKRAVVGRWDRRFGCALGCG